MARAYIAQLDRPRLRQADRHAIDPAGPFYPAEAYHQDYLTLNPDSGYILYNDLPKVQDLKSLFPEAWREAPVLVRTTSSQS